MAFSDTFKRDVACHKLQIFRDDGVNRHIRFKAPGTMCMHFDLLTWPGYLCYTGDMGTYVFRRLDDMFAFFRRRDSRPEFEIDLRYWAEKLEALDRAGVTAYSAGVFRSAILESLQSYCDGEEFTEAEREAIFSEVDTEVLQNADDEYQAMRSALDFQHGDRNVFEGFWETDYKEYTHRFLWCCHALEWAIGVYDAAKLPAAVAVDRPPHQSHESAIIAEFKDDPREAAEYLAAVLRDGGDEEVKIAVRRVTAVFGET